MNKPQWWRKLQYHRHQKHQITSGSIYHKHCNQVIVSKQELYIQLKESWLNENLLACLAFGSGHPRYAYWLLMASIKFWFIGSLSYPLRNSREKAHAAKGTMPQKGEWLFSLHVLWAIFPIFQARIWITSSSFFMPLSDKLSISLSEY